MTNPLRRNGNSWLGPVIVVCITLLVVVVVASYTYLEAMGPRNGRCGSCPS